tara:strand:- start:186 stop:374 length:189 start_codon:yes stop_codon:yes gene_type:complete
MACQLKAARKAAGAVIARLKPEMLERLKDMQSSKKPPVSKRTAYEAAERYALEEYDKVPLHP